MPDGVQTLKSAASNTAAGDRDQNKSPGRSTEIDRAKSTVFQLFQIDMTPYNVMGCQANWYKAMPYGFRFYPRNSTHSLPYTFYLPISPSDITITTHFATNIIPTLYGTVEEHSEQRYFDIVISGTTGVSPKYCTVNPGQALIGRKGPDLSVIQKLSQVAGGAFSKFLGTAQNLANKATSTKIGAAIVSGGAGTKESAGVEIEQTGYVAFHRFYKFLLAYKRDIAGLTAAGPISHHPLSFINYKDHNEYKCVVQRFVLRRSSRDPLLYEYNIVLRAYELNDLSGPPLPNEMSDRLSNLGLSGKNSSIFSDIKNEISGAKSVAGLAGSGTSQIGKLF